MSLLKSGRLYSIVNSKCPKCNIGNLYVDNNPYHLKKLADMNKVCDHCGQRFEPETGFYYGAMYVSYGLSIVVMFIPAGILYFLFDASFQVLLGTVLGIYVFLYPLLFRWSRNIWLSTFVHFDPEAKAKFSDK